MKLIPILLFLSGGLFFGLLEFIYTRYAKNITFKMRENLEIDELYDKYFAGSGVEKEEFKKIIVEFAKIMHIPVGKLRPSDSFDNELKGTGLIIEWGQEDLISLFYERMWKKTGEKTKELPEIKTLGDYIKAMKQYI